MNRALVERAGITHGYIDYQQRYAAEPRESDKVLIEMVAAAIEGRDKPKLLDLGCSTGNFLAHLARRFAWDRLQLVGGDVSPASLEGVRSAAPYAESRYMNMLDMRCPGEFDVIVASAVTYPFTDEEYVTALRNVARSLKPGGVHLTFEWAHAFAGQHLAIKETTLAQPEGVMLYARPQEWVERTARSLGFADVAFRPFSMPLDLPPQVRRDGVQASHTVRLETGERLSMRGAIVQPWCFVTARKGT